MEKRFSHLAMVIVAILSILSCTEDMTTDSPQTEPTAETIINGSGDPVVIGGSTEDSKHASAASAKLFNEIYGISVETETRMHYRDKDTLGLSPYFEWDNNDHVSLRQYAIGNDNKVLAESFTFSYRTEGGGRRTTIKGKDDKNIMRWFKTADVDSQEIASYRLLGAYPEKDEHIGDTDETKGKETYKGKITALSLNKSGEKINQDAPILVEYDTPRRQVVTINNSEYAKERARNGSYIYQPQDNQLFQVGYANTSSQWTQMHFKPILSTVVLKIVAPNNNEITRVDSVKLRLFKGNSYVGFAPKYRMLLKSDLTKYQELKRLETNERPVDIVVRFYNKNGADDDKKKSQEISAGKDIILTAYIPAIDLTKGNPEGYRVQAQVFCKDPVEVGAISIGEPGNLQGITYYTLPAAEKLAAKVNLRKVDPANWMNELPENTPIRNLSLPGAHIAAWALSDESGHDPIQHSTQDVSIKTMLEQGVRVFDLRMNSATVSNPTPPADQIGPATYNRNSNGEPFRYQAEQGNAVKIAKVFNDFMASHKGESVFIILSSVATAGKSTVSERRTEMINLWNSISGNCVEFSPDLTIGDAKGHLVLMVRPDPGFDVGAISPLNVPDKYIATNNQEQTYYDTWVYRTYSKKYCPLTGWHMAYGDQYAYFSPKSATEYKTYNAWSDDAWSKADGVLGSFGNNTRTLKNENSFHAWQDKESYDRGRYWYNARMLYLHDWDPLTELYPQKTYLGADLKVLDFEVIQKGTYTFTDYYGKTWTGLKPIDFKFRLMIDFMRMAGDPRYSKHWFATMLPVYINGDATQRNWWAYNVNGYNDGSERVETLPKMLLENMRGNIGRNRFGFIFLDGIPDKTKFANYNSSNVTYNNDSWDGQRRKIIQEVMNAILINNALTNIPK